MGAVVVGRVIGFLADPVAGKELSGLTRRWPMFAARTAYTGVVLLVIVRFWFGLRPGLLSASDYAELGRSLFLEFLLVQTTFVALAAIAAGGDLLAREVRAGTLGLLLLTSMTMERIVWAKWKAAMVQAGSLLLGGLPVVAVCVYLGGVGPVEVLWSSASALALAGAGAALALRLSATRASGERAMFLAAGGVAVSLLPFGILSLFGQPGLFLAGVLHPAFAAIAPASMPWAPGFAWLWVPSGAVSLLYSVRELRKAARRVEARGVAQPRPAPALRDFETRPSYFGRRITVSRGVWERHPLLWKELATRPAARLGGDLRVAVVALFFFFLLVAGLVTGGDLRPLFWATGAMALVLALLNGSALFVRERESRMLDVLRSTPLGAVRIVVTKLVAGVVAPESLGVLALAGLLIPGLAAKAGWGYFLIFAGATALSLALAYVVGALASLRARTFRGAFVGSCAALGTLYFALPAALGLSNAGSGASTWARLLSPPYLLTCLADRGGAPFAERLRAAGELFPAQAALYAALLAAGFAAMVVVFRRTAPSA